MIKQLPNRSTLHNSKMRIEGEISPSFCRKPRFTYKSPSGIEDLLNQPTTSSNVQQSASPSLVLYPSPLPQGITNSIIYCNTQRRKTRIYPVSRSLPLYHPLGRLALSLPPLDPSTFGLPIPTLADESNRRLSGRARRPVAKLRELEDEEVTGPLPTVSSIAAVAAREMKERPSPRKRRVGGAKRKRKEVEDGDATYPAKRSRLPRGAANAVAEEESPTELEAAVTDVTPGPDETNLERRLTRSRGRRDSSASDTNSLIIGNVVKTETEEKEEGELSEECIN